MTRAAAWCCVLLTLLLSLSCKTLAKSKPKNDDNKLANRTIERTVQLRTHSIYAPYIDQDLQNRWWDFGADAHVNTNKHIRLTRAAASQTGWLWSRLPMTAQNWIIEVEFKISGEQGYLVGDGMAMWLTTARAEVGPIFGNVDRFTGLGITMDTYANSRHTEAFPRISATMGDGQTSFDYGNDGFDQALGGCSLEIRQRPVPTKMKVTYLAGEWLEIKFQFKAVDEWTDCISLYNVTLPPAPFLGFTAMTGDVYDAHDIISVTSYTALLSSPDKPRDKHHKQGTGVYDYRAYQESRSRGLSWGWLWRWTWRIALVCALAWGVWWWLNQQKRRGNRGGLGLGLSPTPAGWGGKRF